MQNILFFGDSLTAGYGLRNAATESFPALIRQKIDAEKLDYKIINAGLSGDTSAVSIFVLELGINDIIRGITPSTTLKNLQAITDKVKAKYPQAKIAVMGMEIPAFIHSPVAASFSEVYRTLASANQSGLVPFFLNGVAGKPQLNMPDRLHPNAEGYKVIADNVWPAIKQLLV